MSQKVVCLLLLKTLFCGTQLKYSLLKYACVTTVQNKDIEPES